MTKKILVPYSIEKASPVGKSFVVPVYNCDRKAFVSLGSLKTVDHAAVVYLGRQIAPEDLFAKIVDSGAKILPSVDGQIAMINEYFDHLSKLKIGDIVKVGFDLNGRIKLAKQPKPQGGNLARKLP